MTDWKVGKGARSCARTERAFAPGEEYYSALVEDADGFRRLDFAVDAWGKEDIDAFFSFWKTRMPGEDEDDDARRIVDTEVVYRFFRRLLDAGTPEKQTFRYLLTLLLVRKRYLRLVDFAQRDGREVLLVRDRRAEEDLAIPNPDATTETLAAAQRELGCLFDADFEDDAPGDGAAASAHAAPEVPVEAEA